MGPRVLTSLAYLVAWLALAIVGGWWLTVGVILLSWIGVAEFRHVLGRRRVRISVEVAYPAALAYCLAAALYANDLEAWFLAVLGILWLSLLATFALHLRAGHLNASEGITGTLFATVLCGLLPSLIVLIRHLEPQLTAELLWWQASFGFRLLAYVLGVTMLADVGGFAIGKRFGRHKFAETVSPNKTWEGLGGVLGAAVLASLALGALFSIGPLPGPDGPAWWVVAGHRVALGLLLGIAGQLGDFGTSAFKRESQVKDFGSLLPGHGGVLDRLDALLVSLPLVLLYARAAL